MKKGGQPGSLAKFQMVVGLLLIFLMTAAAGRAGVVEYDLTIAWQEVEITGQPTAAMTINGTIPGPVLRFKEGDLARIHVRNRMEEGTSIHWHGILVPPGMDGVPFISFPPIAPGAVFTYEFPVRQNGTYWYHSHTGLQEQRGVYGSIVIEPPEPGLRPDRDYVVLFSDWIDEDPHSVLRTLKRGSEWYALEKGGGQSLIGAARLGMLGDYFKRELQRMPPMDISDVAYDRFLANGEPEIELQAKPGETVRLRIIDGSSSTFFHLEFAGGPVSIIAADGQEVEPLEQQRFLIGVAETYDLLINVPAAGSYEFRATAHDGSAWASAWIGSGERHPAPEVPRPNLYHAMGELTLPSLFSFNPAAAMGMGDDQVRAGRFDKPGMMPMGGMDGMEHGMEHGMEMKEPMEQPAMHHPGHGERAGRSGRIYGANFKPLAADISSADHLAMDGMESSRPWPPYEKLRAARSTAFAGDQPVRQIRLTLDGDMERYVWFMDNQPLSESDDILIHAGEIVRFIMINRTMMHHPMHLHGHLFRVINGQGDQAPLKHTVDVAPMSTTVIEFDANEIGDWFFHCHLLYHMESGMARLVHYGNYSAPEAVAAIRPQLYRDHWYQWGEAEVLSNMTEGYLLAANIRHTLVAEWESGWERVEKNEWEGLFFWDLYFNRFFTVFAGLDLLGEGSKTDHSRGVFGITYLLPLHIESRYWLDTDGGGRFKFDKELVLTPRLALRGEAEYDTHASEWEGKASLVYTVAKNFSVIGQWHSDYGWGAGAIIRF